MLQNERLNERVREGIQPFIDEVVAKTNDSRIGEQIPGEIRNLVGLSVRGIGCGGAIVSLCATCQDLGSPRCPIDWVREHVPNLLPPAEQQNPRRFVADL